MTRSKLGALVFCAVVLGLMAFNTGIASADWSILMSNGEVLTGAQLTAALRLERDTIIVLHSKILGLTVLYECAKIEGINFNLLKNGTVAKEFNAEGKPVGAQAKLSECIAIIGGEKNASCTPNAEGTQPGVMVSNPLHGVIAGDFIQILPDTGETYSTSESSASCPIGKKVPLIGKVTLKDCESLFLSHLVKHLLEVGPSTELWLISKTAEHGATILGGAWAFLGGAHAGLAFGG
jgi:hypothetical protein